jgi:hypothetical protein
MWHRFLPERRETRRSSQKDRRLVGGRIGQFLIGALRPAAYQRSQNGSADAADVRGYKPI